MLAAADLLAPGRSQAHGCHAAAAHTCRRKAWWKIRTLARRGPNSSLFAASLGSGAADVAPPVLFPSGVPVGDGSERRQPTAAAAITAASNAALPEAVTSLLHELQVGLGQPTDIEAVSLRLKQLADLLRGAPQWQLQAVRRHPVMRATMAALASTAPATSPVLLCTALLAAAHLQLKLPREQLEALGACLADATPSAPPDQLVRGAWALSRLGFCTPRLLAAFEEQALGGSWLQELDVNGLTSLLWVCNRASFGPRPLLGAVMEGIRRAADPPQAAAARSSTTKWGSGGKHTRSSTKQLATGAGAAAEASAWAGGGSSGSSSSSSSAVSSGRSSEEGMMTSRQVSMALYSCAAMRYIPNEEALAALCAQAQLLLPSFTPQGLSNTAWSLGRLGHRDSALMEGIAQASLRMLPSFSPHELALLASGFGGINFRHRELLCGIAARMADPELLCNATDLSHVLGTLATLGIHPGEELLANLEHTATQLVRAGAKRQQQQQQQSGKQQQQQQQQRGKQHASSQGHSNGAGAAAGAATAAAAGAAGGGVQGGSVQPAAVCWVLWALARLGHQPRGLLRAAEESWRRAPVRLYELGPEDTGRLLWVLAKMEHRSGALLEELALVVRRLLPRMPPQSLAMVLHGYAALGFPPHELLDGAAEHMAAGLASYPPQSVGTMVWAFAKLGVHPGRGLPGGGIATEDGKALLQAAEEYAVAQVEELAAQTMALLCWGLATLHHHPGYPFLDAIAGRMARQCLPGGTAQQRQQQQQGQQGRVGEDCGSMEGQLPVVGEGPVGGHASQALSLVAWSFAQWGHSDERLHKAIQRTLLPHGPAAQLPVDLQPLEQQQQQQQGGELAGRAAHAPNAVPGEPNLAPLTVSNFAFALAKQGVHDPELVHALRLAAEPQIHRYAPQELTNLLWCHASLGVQPPTPFLEAAVHALRPHLATCDASLVALAVHSLATLRYAPPDEWLDEAVRCVVAAVQEELDEQDSLTDQEDTGEGGAEQGDAASSAGQGAAVGAQQVAAWRTENGTIGGSVAGDGGRHSRARRRSRAPAGVHVTLLAKLLWGCAHLGYQPSPAQLELLTDSAQWQLSHTRSRGTVLHASELVRLLWALAVLEQYSTSLYRNLCFRTSRLPIGSPKHPACIRLLRQVAMLSTCEARLVSLPLRGTNMLPEWLREDGPSAQKLATTKPQIARPTGATATAAVEGKAAAVAEARGVGAAQQQVHGPVRKQAAVSSSQQQQQQQQQQAEEGSSGSQASAQTSEASGQASEVAAQQGGSSPAKAAAESVAEALRRARCRPVAVRQLLFGDWVVIYKFEDSGQAAVLPWVPDLRAANDEARAVGSAVATLRILAAKGFPVVLGGPDMRATVAECLDLWT